MRVIGERMRNRPQSTHGSLYNLQLKGKYRPNTHCGFDIRVCGMTLEDLPRTVDPKTDTRNLPPGGRLPPPNVSTIRCGSEDEYSCPGRSPQYAQMDRCRLSAFRPASSVRRRTCSHSDRMCSCASV